MLDSVEKSLPKEALRVKGAAYAASQWDIQD